MTGQTLRTLVKEFPDTPGVYFFCRGDEVLYVGKATSLKDRVKSYAATDLIATRGPLLVDMVTKADHIRYEQTDSVLEALIAEAQTIKRLQPYYNTKEKDDKSFLYVCITKEAIPRIITVRGKDIKGKHAHGHALDAIYGPYTSGTALKEALRIIRKIFPFIDGDASKKQQQEFYRQLQLVPESQEAYIQSITHIKLFLSGKKKSLLTALEKQMKQYAKNLAFEKAAQIKKQLFALSHIQDVSLLKKEYTDIPEFRIEAYDIAHTSGMHTIGVMVVVVNGVPDKKSYRLFKIKGDSHGDDLKALHEVISRRLAHTEWPLPQVMVIDGGKTQRSVAAALTQHLSIELISVIKDDRHTPKDYIGNQALLTAYKDAFLLANSEAHRFALQHHRKRRDRIVY